jgi:uncharacterized protein GlcG (DUF336 family)
MPRLGIEPLEPRHAPAVTAALAGGVLTVLGDGERDSIRVSLDPLTNQVVVRDFLVEVGRFASPAVAALSIDAGGGDDVVRVDRAVTQPAVIQGGDGDDILEGGGGPTTLLGGPGSDKLTAGPAPTTLDGGPGPDTLLRVKIVDTVLPDPEDRVAFFPPPVITPVATPQALTTEEVQCLLDRASAATPSNDAIIAIVDRGGRLLGVRAEAGVNPALFADPRLLAFAVDGAIAKARTGAFFGNNQAPLTSRTIQFISQTTMTQREIESVPSITDPNSTLRGPGFVAPIGIKGHFPPNVPFTPQVDLFAIEHTNRDSIVHPGPDRIKGTGDDVMLPARFNVDPAFVPAGAELTPPESYGFISGIFPDAQARGIATLPGGIPIYKRTETGGLDQVGGIGVFFPGRTGFATEENSALNVNFDPSRPDRSFEAEYIAFAALGGVVGPTLGNFPVGTLGGVPQCPGISLPSIPPNRIDLVGITLDIFGPGGRQGPERLFKFGMSLGQGLSNGTNLPVTPGGATLIAGRPVPDGFLVLPHDGDGITAAEVLRIIVQGVHDALTTRAAIRLPLNSETRMVFAVADRQGEIVGLFRMPDATIFSIDVAVAKARNVAYYANPALLQPIDQVPGVRPGTALTNRSFRYLALPRFPEGIEGAPPGPFSILNDGGVDPNTGLNVGPPLPASAYQSVQGFDAFNPGTNFRNPLNPTNQNGIVFFPGSAPLYRGGQLLIGGFGVSGDGVDQDDVVTNSGAAGFEPNPLIRIDQVFVRGVRVPYQKFNRNPQGGLR